MGSLIALYVAALAARVAAGIAFLGPAYTDSAYYVDVARQLAAGHGLNVPFVWAFLEVGGHIPAMGTLPIPSNAHWLPLASLVQVPSIWLLGPTDLASQLPFWLAGATLAPLTYLIGRDAGLPRWICLAGGALMVAPGAFTPFLGQPDNFGLYGPLGAGALWACARGLRGQRRAFVLGGLLVGLASLARNDGVLLGVPFALAFGLERWRTLRRGASLRAPGPIGWASAVGCFALFLLVMAPWWVRQIATFGALLPSATSGRLLWITTYEQTFSTVGSPGPATFLSQGLGPLIASRIGGSAAAIGLFAYLPFAVVLAPLVAVGAWIRRRDSSFAPWLIYGFTLLASSTFLFALQVPSGNFIHSAIALVPHADLLMLLGLQGVVGWIARRRPAWRAETASRFFATGAVAIVALFALGSSLQTVAGWRAYRSGLAPIAAQVRSLPAGDVVLSSDPAGLWYLAGRPGVVTPADPLPVVEQAAQAYGARWLVLDASSIVPSLQPVLSGAVRPPWLSRPLLSVPDARDPSAAPQAVLYAVCLSPDDPRCG